MWVVDENSKRVANQFGMRFALNDPQEGGKWVASEHAELFENNRGSGILLSATWEAASPCRCWLQGPRKGFGRGITNARGTVS